MLSLFFFLLKAILRALFIEGVKIKNLSSESYQPKKIRGFKTILNYEFLTI